MSLDTEAAPSDPGSSRRDALEAAFEAAESGGEGETAPPAPAPEPVYAEPEAPEPAPEAKEETAAERRARDEKGRFQTKTAEKAAVKPGPAPKPAAPSPTPKPTKPLTNGTPPPQAAEQTSTALKPPASWKPAAREQWAKLPPEVQQETVRREREAQQTLQESAEARRNWTSFQQAVAPYEAMVRAEGANPVQAAASLFQTAAALRTAPPAHKAQLIARMVQDYGIDIQMLDQALAGQAPAPQQHAPAQYQDPRVDQLMARLQGAEQQRQQSAQQRATQEAQAFAANAEFFEDVRQEMADLMEVAARRGVSLSMEDAYNRAVKLNPEISGVLSQREQAKTATASTATMQRSRAAAASVKSRPAGPASSPAPTGRRGALEAAWDSLER